MELDLYLVLILNSLLTKELLVAAEIEPARLQEQRFPESRAIPTHYGPKKKVLDNDYKLTFQIKLKFFPHILYQTKENRKNTLTFPKWPTFLSFLHYMVSQKPSPPSHFLIAWEFSNALWTCH